MAYRGRGEVQPERPRIVEYGRFRPRVLEVVLILFSLVVGVGGIVLFASHGLPDETAAAPFVAIGGMLAFVAVGVGAALSAMRRPTSVELAFFDRSREVEVRSRRLWLVKRSHRLSLEGVRTVEIEHRAIRRLSHSRYHPGDPGGRIWLDYGPGGRRALTDSVIPGWRNHEVIVNELSTAAGLGPRPVPDEPVPGSVAAARAHWNRSAKSSFKKVALVSVGMTVLMVGWSSVEMCRREQAKEHHGFIELTCIQRCMVGTVDDCPAGGTMRVGRSPGRIRIDVHEPETGRWRYEWVEVQTGEVTPFVCR